MITFGFDADGREGRKARGLLTLGGQDAKHAAAFTAEQRKNLRQLRLQHGD